MRLKGLLHCRCTLGLHPVNLTLGPQLLDGKCNSGN